MMGEGQIIIESAVLYIRKVQIESSYLLEIEKQLSTQNALYPLQHCEMLTYTIATGSQSHQKEGLFRGHMPKMVFVGMVTNKAYNGTRATNPFNFEHFNANHVALYKDGSSIPFLALTLVFSKMVCSREFQVLLQNLELFNRNEEFDITLDDFIAGGYTLFAFNLTPDLSLTGVCQPYQEGNLRLELKFSEALRESINVIVMSIFDGKVEITKDLNLLVDYKG